jgi:8-oxo-dGTP diphosphatase
MTPLAEIDKVGWLHIEDKRLLAVRSRGKTLFYTPGGKRESGESDEMALAREIREELSVELDMQTIEYVGAFRAAADANPDGAMVKVICYRAEFAGEIVAANEIEEVAWLKYADRPRCSAALQMILDRLRADGVIS